MAGPGCQAGTTEYEAQALPQCAPSHGMFVLLSWIKMYNKWSVKQLIIKLRWEIT